MSNQADLRHEFDWLTWCKGDSWKLLGSSRRFGNEGITMRILFLVLIPQYGNAFVQGFYLEFKNKSCQISSLEDIFRKPFKMSVRTKSNRQLVTV